jgi:thiol-disulfide isomerase/thioredoxin
MDRSKSALTPARYATGMTFDQYVAYVATPANLAREASGAGRRREWSGFLRESYQAARLSEPQAESARWLAAQPGGPAKIMMISEEWSSDCRRDLPMLARLADTAGMELRIFARDGQKFSASPRPVPGESPNGDLMAEFPNEKNGHVYQSIPVIAFYTRDLGYLCHYIEFPAIYHKDPIVYGHIRAARPGETKDQTAARADREFAALQASPFFKLWASAAVDDWLSALHRRLLLGPA